MKRVYVNIGHKQYRVLFRDDGYPPSISTTWEVINPRTVWNAHPEYWTRCASISPHGALGKKILKLAEQGKEGSQ